MAQFKSLTKAEEQVMQGLWKIGQGFTKDIIAAMKPEEPHYNTVSTILKILLEKGFVQAKPLGNAHLFEPLVQKDEYSKGSVRNIIKGYFGGSFTKMLSHFAGEKDISVEELEQLLKEVKKGKK